MACAPSEDSDQPGHPPSLIRVFAVHMKKAWVLTYPPSAQSKTDQTGPIASLSPILVGRNTPAEAFLWELSFHRLRSLHILWYYKIDFLISQNNLDFFFISRWFFDIKKSNLWYHKIEFVISKNQGYFVISKNLFYDIKKSNLWCHKIDFLISQNHEDFVI